MASSGKAFAIDTSGAVPASDEQHEAHASALAAVREFRPALAGHAAFETYSVLTRQPEPRRLSPSEASVLLATNFPGECFPGAESAARLFARCGDLGLTGATVYDALVAQAALDNGRVLLTRDRRAQRTYELIGVEFELIR